MLARSFLWLTRHFPSARRLFFRHFFDWLARRLRNADHWTFMNYGYAQSGDAGLLPLDPADERERYCIQLYHHVASGASIADKDVLEVSSGRGGGASYICRYLGPRSVTAVDIAPSAIAFCRRVHRLSGLRFIQGDAEDLPLFDASVDVVLNIEASFCYGRIDRFLSEVRRVLRPGGHFLYADLRLAEEVPDHMAAMRRSGLELVCSENITADVCRALQLDGIRRIRGAAEIAPTALRAAIRLFVGAPGTRMPRLLGSGKMQYHRCVLRKPPNDPLVPVDLPADAGERVKARAVANRS